MTPIHHSWQVDPHTAIEIQRQYAPLLDNTTPIDLAKVRFVAGVDVSVKHEMSRAAVVVLTFPDLQIIEQATATLPTTFPYISGLLTFREGEVILAAHAKLNHRPDVYIFDGMGIIHPRRIGIAAHMGLWLDAPTVGCGKTHFLGTYAEPNHERGAYTPLMHQGQQLGVVLRTREGVAPVYISPGHKATIDSARALVMACTGKYRLPIPIRAAHQVAGQFE